MEKKYILDTNILMVTEGKAIYGFDDNIIVIPAIVLEELDNLKTSYGETGYQAREAIRVIDSITNQSGFKSWNIPNCRGALEIVDLSDFFGDLPRLPKGYNDAKADNIIIATALLIKQNELHKNNPEPVLVTNDTAMRVKALTCGLNTQSYKNDQVKEDFSYTGRTHISTDRSLETLFSLGMMDPPPADSSNNAAFREHEFVHVTNGTSSALCKYENGKLVLLPDYNTESTFGIFPKNQGQRYALDALLAPADEIPLVLLKGPAGTGKTLLSLAAALSQTYTQFRKVRNNDGYDKIICARANVLADADIGYLPGDVQEKTLPLLAPIIDNLEYLLGNEEEDKETVATHIDSLLGDGIIEVTSLAYIRGRSLPNAFIMIDECFTGDTCVLLSDGNTMGIKYLVNRHMRGQSLPEVVSYNIEKGIFENKKVTNARYLGEKDIVSVYAANRRVKCTPNHPFLTTKGWKRADELTPGDALMMTTPSTIQTLPVLNDDQYQIVLGSFLGDGGIDAIADYKCRINYTHSLSQKEYCEWKAKMLGQNNTHITKPCGFSNTKKARGITPVFYFPHKDFTRKKSGHIPQWLVDELDWRGIAVWFMDDGSSHADNSATIASYSFDEESLLRISQKLNDMGAKNTVYPTKRKYFGIRFNKEGWLTLKKNIEPFVHPSMLYKIGVQSDAETYIWDSNFKNYGVNVVKEVVKEKKKERVYDIEVADNHNFCITSRSKGKKIKKHDGFIVHNCQNLSRLQAKTILTRVGMGTKIVFMGDIDQIDNPKLDKKSCGLSYLSEKFMGNSLCAQVEFLESESVRSPLAAEAINLL